MNLTNKMMNKKLPTIQIKGKDYVMVKDRVLAFNELYPTGSIITEKFIDGDIIVFKATVTPDIVKAPQRVFTGHSEAIRGVSQGITGQSPVEVAETSAVGRALAMMGIGIVDSIASADEIKKANILIDNARTGQPSSIIDYQEVAENMPQALPRINDAKKVFNRSKYTGLVTAKQLELIMNLCLQKGLKTTVKEIDKLTVGEASRKIKSLQELPDIPKSKSEEQAEDAFEEELDDDGAPPITEEDLREAGL